MAAFRALSSSLSVRSMRLLGASARDMRDRQGTLRLSRACKVAVQLLRRGRYQCDDVL
ncbi:hypothetical protein AURDEDRAFT_111383 [Auricularia subglabra TFB-10046 SS5]|nr:hypothetical protein AURDEDRAFT_111383 [Auricularia subglabra TFB-10046 SS5]